MAVTTAYATAAEFRARVSKQDTGDDTDLGEALLAASRMIEDDLGRVFNASAANKARWFDGGGAAVLRVDDLQSIDAEGIAVDTTGDGTLDTTFDLTTETWVISEPYNASELGQPITALRLLPLSGASASVGEVLTAWPQGKHNIKITGTWGWAAVPDAIREYCCLLARDLRDSLEGGPGAQLVDLGEGSVPLQTDTRRLRAMVRQAYHRRIPAIA